MVTLTTDFGGGSLYVAQMKGSLARVCPQCTVVDVTHEVPPQDVGFGARVLRDIYGAFPAGTVHLAVVDPGVGTSRPLLAARWDRHLFVGPDNGLLSWVARRARELAAAPSEIVELDQPAFWLSPVSATFHGRDILAPVAAHLACGIPLSAVGRPRHTIVEIPEPMPIRNADQLVGEIMAVDRFGNLITNVRRHDLEWARAEWGHADPDWTGVIQIGAGSWTWREIHMTYQDVRAGESLCLFGSNDYLEVAICCGHAHRQLGISVGQPVVLQPARP